MAEFDVTLSSLTEASGNMRSYCEEFKVAADELKVATENLTSASDGWNGEASQIFNENIVEAHRWLTEMSVLVDEYAATLDKTHDIYQEADESAAKGFR